MEVAAELHDLIKEDVARKFPSVAVRPACCGPGGFRFRNEGGLPLLCSSHRGKGGEAEQKPAQGRATGAGITPCTSPCLQEDVSITLIDGMDSLLNSYHT